MSDGDRWRAEAPERVDGDLLLKITARAHGVIIGPARILGARAVLWSGKNSDIDDLVISRIVATDLGREGIRLDGDVGSVAIDDFDLSAAKNPAEKLAGGIVVRHGENIVISNGRVAGFRTVTKNGKYPKGDGIAAERGVDRLKIDNVFAEANADAGFDLKARHSQLHRLTSSRNYRNFRFWGTVDAGTLISVAPSGAHIWVGKDAIVKVAKLVARGAAAVPLVQLEAGARLDIDSCDLEIEGTNTFLIEKPASAQIHLGVGCQ
ncbi:MAG: hypothetical protein WA979_12390 [Pacificimonas sp.]